MANTHNQVTITVTNAEVAAELEALAQAYEETVQKLRYEADRLRQGFQLTLNVSATQAVIAKPTEPHRGDDEFDEGAFDEQDPDRRDEASPSLRMRRAAEKHKLVANSVSAEDLKNNPIVANLEKPVGNLPDEALKLIDEMTKTTEEEE